MSSNIMQAEVCQWHQNHRIHLPINQGVLLEHQLPPGMVLAQIMGNVLDFVVAAEGHHGEVRRGPERLFVGNVFAASDHVLHSRYIVLLDLAWRRRKANHRDDRK